ncbi:hypothetical protein FE257_000259 [Aspergillus nanangensis]|uniref:Uncharacterized protein n=1 Tax=Aspergillus nanangensis TaxID=2582783 RepID=A0AAD4CZ16_ASPNN|nr:hypothetical protein FE257_000259 [Aspergillus nanangensis]
MCSDLTIPAMLGYFMGMCYNPNNVALEVSPFTTHVEHEVGQQFCHLFGYNTDPDMDMRPVAWGHVTSGGTVANIESFLVARNIKFYPLALRRAIDDGDLRFLNQRFVVETCMGETKLFKSLSTWELLNLRVDTILDIPQSLYRQFGITRRILDDALRPYCVQSTGTGALERHFGINKPPQLCLGKTGHYSWEKGAAMIGIGSDNVIGIDIDHRACVDLPTLETHLQQCLDTQQAVYAVVAIIGSTEEGSVDNLRGIVDMRLRFQAKGLSFCIHTDAAWGGYFAAMLPSCSGESVGMDHGLDLRPETACQLRALRHADSITVDPHKAGYIPYPAGCLVYRDEPMKHLIAWTSPYLSQGSECGSMGVYGLEGSKPGAAAMSVWLSHTAIGLNYRGYGSILRQASFNSAMMAAWWATLTTEDDCFVCVPFDMLPSESLGDRDAVTQEKDRIRADILGKSYEQTSTLDTEGPSSPAPSAMTLLRQLGSELNINTFALNWRHRDGTLNTDTVAANQLMKRVVKRLSVDSSDTDPTKIPFYLTSTEFSVQRYGKCVANFKLRLQLEQSAENLFVLRNVVMSPFGWGDFVLRDMMDAFRQIVVEEVEECRKRNEACSDAIASKHR